MDTNVLMVILWAACGILTIVSSFIDPFTDRRTVPLVSYILCWIVLMLALIQKVI